MEDLRRRTGRSGLEIILVNVWEGIGARNEALGFCDLWGVEGSVLLDEEGTFAEQLGIRGVPTNVLVDTDGTVTAVGAVTPGDLEAAVRRLLGPDAAIDAPVAPEWHWGTEATNIERNISARGSQDD